MEMTKGGQARSPDSLVAEIIDAMANKAVKDAGPAVKLAVERFSAGIDRLLQMLPVDRRASALLHAKSHGYCTPDQIERMRREDLRH